MEEKLPSSSNKNVLKIIISIILIIIGVIAIAYFLWFVFSKREVTFNLGSINPFREITSNTNIANTNIAVNKEANQEAKARDEQRISQIKEIQKTLESFKNDKGNYPEKMEELVSEKYLSELPKNPTPGGIDYVYTPIGSLPAQYYDLAYSLEVGTDEVKEPGDHIANPDGIAYL